MQEYKVVRLPSGLILGKPPFVPDDRDLLFRNYRKGGVPLPIPPSGDFGHIGAVSQYGMLGNGPDPTVSPGFQGAGDCVWAAFGHQTMVWTAIGVAGAPVPINGADAIADYSADTGYNPVTGAGDNGTSIRGGLKYLQQPGIVDSNGVRHTCGAYVLLDQDNLRTEVTEALYLCDGVVIGLNFPDSAEDQFNNGQVWAVITGATIVGGHCVPILQIIGGDPECVTWALGQKMTWDFLQTYCDEAWAVISQAALNGAGKSPEGFDYATLGVDVQAITGMTPVVTPPTPGPVGSEVTITVTDGQSNIISGTFELDITGEALVITAQALPSPDIDGEEYAYGVQAAGGLAPYAWSATGLPPGITIAPASGLIEGVPTQPGTYSIAVTVTDSSSPVLTATATFTLVITPAALAFVTTSLPAGEPGIPYDDTVQVTGGYPPYTFEATGLPTGLTINAATGEITGTPAAANKYVVKATVKDAAGSRGSL